MCGRYNLRTSPAEIAEMFGLLRVPEFETRYNIAPTQQSLFVHVDDASQRMGQLGRWGLVPPWVKDVKQMGAPLINARAETAREKRSFQQAFKHRRCLVPASGFYEWLRQGKDKQPYHIHRQDDAPFLMAGLWEPGKPADGRTASFTILTTAANALMSQIHDRMPVVLTPEEYVVWLDHDLPLEAFDELLQPREWEAFELVPANPLVNSWKNETPECLQPE